MQIQRRWRQTVWTGWLALAGLVPAAPAAAHCDSMDGPVVTAAREALERGEVAGVLAWVRVEDEAEIVRAFERTLAVRQRGADARELADLWFFETLVRVHREGEGAPYTGLKPAGSGTTPAIAAADRALETGQPDELARALADGVAEAIRDRYARVLALRDYDPRDADAGRRYVEAYVDYVHFVEGLHDLLHGSGDTHTEPGAPANGHAGVAGL